MLTPTWIGSPQANLFRRGQCIQSTTPHAQKINSSGGETVIITNKSISSVSTYPTFDAELGEPWAIADGDTLILADFRLFSLMADTTAYDLVDSQADSPARRLVDHAQTIEHRVARSALVARLM
jgi:hypothetical protein